MGNQGDQTPKLFAWPLLIILSLIWGTSFILIKKGLLVLSAAEVGALRIAAASLFLAPLAIREVLKLSRKDWVLLFIVGMFSIFIPAFLFAIAQTNLDSSLTGVFNALTPLWVLMIGVGVFGQKAGWMQIVGVTLGFIGSVILLFAGSGGNLADVNYYAFFVILATILYAINLNLIKLRLSHLKAKTITSVSVSMVGPLAFIHLLMFTDFSSKTTVDGFWTAMSYIIVLGVMSTAVALMLFNRLVQITTPIFTSSVTYVIPIVAIGWGVLDGEVLLLSHYAGILIILGGVYLVNR